jgi:pyruvate formate lyase activating enzyme
MTLLDYPGKVACTVFLQGCNFRCPFCHNSSLLGGQSETEIATEELLAFLRKRQGLLDGVCITGGEPTLHKDLPELLRRIKDLGFSVKLDTNGSRPDVLKALVAEGLVDYVAMDVKNSPQQYPITIGSPDFPIETIEESLLFLMEGKVDYELRTTVVHPLHDETSIRRMGQWLYDLNGGKKIPKLFLQPFVNRDTVLNRDLQSPEPSQLTRFLELLYIFVQEVSIRG